MCINVFSKYISPTIAGMANKIYFQKMTIIFLSIKYFLSFLSFHLFRLTEFDNIAESVFIRPLFRPIRKIFVILEK